MNIRPIIPLIVSMYFLTACASIEEASAEREALATEPLAQAITDLGYERGEPVKRITDWNLYNWKAVDPQAAIIWVGINRPYLFTLKRLCTNLMFAQTIALSNTASTVTAGLDALLVPNPPGGGERCFIDQIYPLTKTATPAEGDPKAS